MEGTTQKNNFFRGASLTFVIKYDTIKKEKSGEAFMGEHDGHRKRLIAKIDKGALEEHEWLEVLLFSALPRRNTNDIAHRLLAKFQTIPNIFSAPIKELTSVKGVGDSVAGNLRAVGHFLEKYYVKSEKYFVGKYTSAEFIPFVKQVYAKERYEVVDVYLLNGTGEVFSRKRFTDENRATVALQPEELTRVIVEETPSGIVLVHNHPDGRAEPSETDDYTTNKCQVVCSFHNIMFCDHIIYAPDGVYSYYNSGKLKEISMEYSMQGVLGRTPKPIAE